MIVESDCGQSLLTTTPAPVLCRGVTRGYSEVSIKFVSYENMGDIQNDCKRCDSGQQDYCDIVLDICISPRGRRLILPTYTSCDCIVLY